MSGDWLKLHRQSLNSRVFSDDFLWRLWCYLLMKANWKKSFYRGQQIEPGQLVFGRNTAANDLGASASKVYRSMEKLREFGNILIETNRQFSVVTICNWETYQNAVEESEQRVDNDRTTSGQRPDNEWTHTKKAKKDKNCEEGEEDFCSEPQNADSEQAVMILPTVRESESDWRLTQSQIDEWSEAFPGVDVPAECRRARAWLMANTSRGKTYRGMARFLFGWLERSQNSGRGRRSDRQAGELFSGLKEFSEDERIK